MVFLDDQRLTNRSKEKTYSVQPTVDGCKSKQTETIASNIHREITVKNNRTKNAVIVAFCSRPYFV